MTSTTVVDGMCFSFSQLAVAEAFFLSGQSMNVAAPKPQDAGRLLSICPDVVKILAVVALRKGVL
jgi:hypothetical protein